jgi:hypothetical protein
MVVPEKISSEACFASSLFIDCSGILSSSFSRASMAFHFPAGASCLPNPLCKRKIEEEK